MVNLQRFLFVGWCFLDWLNLLENSSLHSILYCPCFLFLFSCLNLIWCYHCWLCGPHWFWWVIALATYRKKKKNSSPLFLLIMISMRIVYFILRFFHTTKFNSKKNSNNRNMCFKWNITSSLSKKKKRKRNITSLDQVQEFLSPFLD